MILHRIFCWLTAAWRNVEAVFTGTADIGWWSGCSWQVEEVVPKAEVTISKCEVCGKYDVAWKRL